MPGAITASRHTAAGTAAETMACQRNLSKGFSALKNSFRPITASSGMVNSAITSMLSTARNLLYIGRLYTSRSVNHSKWRPMAASSENRVSISSAHFMGPLTIRQPNRNSMHTIAPTYTGPLVPSVSLKYCGSICIIWASCGLIPSSEPTISDSVTGWLAPPAGRAVAPPLIFGTSSDSDSEGV